MKELNGLGALWELVGDVKEPGGIHRSNYIVYLVKSTVFGVS